MRDLRPGGHDGGRRCGGGGREKIASLDFHRSSLKRLL
jgi:hypothetical protein